MSATAPVPPGELRARVLAYLARHTTLNLATSGPAGLWAAAVLYVADDTRLYFTSLAATRHGQNMLATRQVAGTINDDCPGWLAMKGIQLEGRLDPVDELDERRRAATAYLRRFPYAEVLWGGTRDPDAIARDPGEHGFYRLTPSRLYFIDNELTPGVRAELPLA